MWCVKQKTTPLSKAEKVFNKYIRLRDVQRTGYGLCCTCGHPVHWKEGNAGHFEHGLDFVEENQHLQCVKCNLHLHGNLIRYREFMVKNYGEDFVNKLHVMKHTSHKRSRGEYEILYQYYKRMAKETKEQKGIPG